MITNDTYRRDEMDILLRAEACPATHLMGVETGGYPHTSICEDTSINLDAIARMSADFPQLALMLIDSDGDNLAATFSPELSDPTIYVIDVAGDEKNPPKGGPRIPHLVLLVIHKTELTPTCGANLEVMRTDAARMRGSRPLVLTSLRHGAGVDDMVAFIRRQGLLDAFPSFSS